MYRTARSSYIYILDTLLNPMLDLNLDNNVVRGLISSTRGN